MRKEENVMANNCTKTKPLILIGAINFNRLVINFNRLVIKKIIN